MRRSKNQTELPMEKPAPKALTDDEVARKNDEIRAALRAIKGLKSKMRDDTREGKRSIKEHEMEIDVLLDQIDQGIEMRKQGDLFAGDEAKRALHDVAKKVDPEIAAAFKPSEPHPFQGNGKRDECALCGSNATDEVHAGKGMELVESLLRVNAGEPVGEVIGDIKARRVKRGKGPIGRARKHARA